VTTLVEQGIYNAERLREIESDDIEELGLPFATAKVFRKKRLLLLANLERIQPRSLSLSLSLSLFLSLSLQHIYIHPLPIRRDQEIDSISPLYPNISLSLSPTYIYIHTPRP